MDFRNFYSWAFPVGSVAGIRIRIHLLLVGFWLYQLNGLLQEEDLERSHMIVIWTVSIAALFGSILLHEFGHCFAARRVGGSADDVLLWPLGGLAFCDAPNTPRAQFIVAAGGPAVTAVIAATSWIAFELIPKPQPYSTADYYHHYAHFYLVDMQLFLFFFNSIPLYPLDGGRMFHALYWGFLSRRGHPGAYGRATLITVYTSRTVVVLGAVYCLYSLFSGQGGTFILLFIFLWSWQDTERLYMKLREGHTDDSVFGYDFSRGYTSLGDHQTRSKPKREGMLERPST